MLFGIKFRWISLVLAIGLTPWIGACSSTDQQQDVDDLQASDEQSNSNTGNQSNSAGENSDSEDEEQAEKAPIADDGYDDDWNNMGTQQQQQKQANNNKKNNATNYGLNNVPEKQEEPEQQESQIAQATNNTNQQVIANQYEEPAQIPANYAAEAPPEVEPAPEPAPQELIPGEIPIGGPLLRNELLPQFAELWWVGYDYAPRDSVVRLELVTRGSPKYNIFQERNQSDQPELVIRFFNTNLRSKVRRDIDASEFRSPVAFVRMRIDSEENNVDVVMTLRDIVRPRLYARNGNLLLTFPIPDHYFGNSTIGDAPVAEAEILPDVNIMPEIADASEIPEGLKVAKAYVPNPAKVAFKDAPDDGGEVLSETDTPVDSTNYDGQGLPDDFQDVSDTTANYGTYGTDSIGGELDSSNYGEESNPLGGNYTGDTGGNYGGDTGSNYGSGNYGTPPAAPPIAAPAAAPAAAPGSGYGGNQYEGSGQSQQASGQLEETNETDSNYEFEDEGEGLEEGEDIEDFDDGEGESVDEIDKFDVRHTPTINPNYQVVSFSFLAVAQDNYGDDYGDGNLDAEEEQESDYGNTQSGNQNTEATGSQQGNSQSNYGGNTTNETVGNFGGGNSYGTNDTGGGNYSDEESGGTNYSGEESGGDNYSGEESGGDDYSGEESGADDYSGEESGADAVQAPSNYGGNSQSSPVANNYGGNSTGGNVYSNNASGYSYSNETAVDSAAPDLAGEDIEGSDVATAPNSQGEGRPISMDFRGAPLREVIRMLSEESGVNFVLSPDIQDREVYLSFTNVSFNTALQALLKSNSLGLVQVGEGLVRIDTLERIAEDEKKVEAARKAQALARPTQVLVYRLNYTSAAKAREMLTPMVTAVADGDTRVNVQIDERTNSLIVNARPTELAMVKTLLNRIDLETPQVKIASRIVEIQKKHNDAFGVSWNSKLGLDGNRGLGFGNVVFPNSMQSNYVVDSGGTQAAAGRAGFMFGSINGVSNLDLQLSLQESTGTTELLQSSNLIVQDNEEATIVSGTTDYFLQAQAAGAANAQGQEAGGDLAEVNYNLNMTVTPHITADGAIQMKLNISSSSPIAGVADAAAAGRTNRSIVTSLLRRSGQTAVIGGIYNTDKTDTKTGVPFFSSIPIIGALFRQSVSSDSKREMLVMVTPTIMSGGASSGGTGSDYSGGVESTGNNTGNYGQQNFGEQTGEGNYNLDGGQEGTENYQEAGNQGTGYNYGTQGTGNNYGTQGTGNNYDTQGTGNTESTNQNYQNQQEATQQTTQQQGTEQTGQQATNQETGGDYENL